MRYKTVMSAIWTKTSSTQKYEMTRKWKPNSDKLPPDENQNLNAGSLSLVKENSILVSIE